MKAFHPDLDTLADEEAVAEFKRSVAMVSKEHRRILAVLIPRLVALQERGDSAAALNLVVEIRRILVSKAQRAH